MWTSCEKSENVVKGLERNESPWKRQSCPDVITCQYPIIQRKSYKLKLDVFLALQDWWNWTSGHPRTNRETKVNGDKGVRRQLIFWSSPSKASWTEDMVEPSKRGLKLQLDHGPFDWRNHEEMRV